MHSHDVCHKVPLPIRGMATLWTLVRLLPRMYHDMPPQVGRVCEAFAAISAVNGFLSFRGCFGVHQEPPARVYTS